MNISMQDREQISTSWVHHNPGHLWFVKHITLLMLSCLIFLGAASCTRAGFIPNPGDGYPGDGHPGDGGSSPDVLGQLWSFTSPGDCGVPDWPQDRIVRVFPQEEDRLRDLVRDPTMRGSTILLGKGTYDLSSAGLVITVEGLIMRGETGDPDEVVLDGGGAVETMIKITEGAVVLADLNLRRAGTHGVLVEGAKAVITGPVIYNVHLQDSPFGVMIKGQQGRYADDGLVACSLIDWTEIGRNSLQGETKMYGVTAFGARGWRVSQNTIRGHWRPSALMGPDIVFWGGSRDTVIERNKLFDCGQCVRFGGDELSELNADATRQYADDPCPGVKNIGGLIRNNFIFTTPQVKPYHDTGIAVWDACLTTVAHNTLLAMIAPRASSIEWRYEGTSVVVINNIASHNLKARSGATASLESNISPLLGARVTFVDPMLGDLHLTPDSKDAIDQGSPAAADLCPEDVDGQPRGVAPDVGADELDG